MPAVKQYVVFRATVSGSGGRTTLIVERPFLDGIDCELWQRALARNLGAPLGAAERETEGMGDAELAAELAGKFEARVRGEGEGDGESRRSRDHDVVPATRKRAAS